MLIRRTLWLSMLILLISIVSLAQDLSLEQIIIRNEEALGGADAINNIQTLRMTYTTAVGPTEIKRIVSIKRPNSMRSEQVMMGMNIIGAHFGATRWSFNPILDTELRTWNDDTGSVDTDVASQVQWLAGLKATGHTIELIGKEEIKDSPVYNLRVTSNNGESTTYYIDAQTFLPVKLFSRLAEGERNIEVERYPSDYRKVDGITFAYSIRQIINSNSTRENYEEILVNTPMDDSIFKPPTAEMLALMTKGTNLRGKLENIKVRGSSLVGNLSGDSIDRDVTVYLPPSYLKELHRRYPVIYLLHGFTSFYDRWFSPKMPDNVPISVEKSISAGSREMIVVMPNALTLFEGSMYSNSITTGDWESYIARDLVAYIDDYYRTIPERASRGLAGHSMGGYGAIRIGFKYPDVFSSIYSMSPCCMEPNMNGYAKAIAEAESVKTPSEIGKLSFDAKAMLASAAAWSPNPKRPPLYLDLPIENGKPRPEIIAEWEANSPLAMVHQYIPSLKKYRAIGIEVGDKDEHFVETTKAFDKILGDYEIKHTFEVYDGDHTNRIPARLETKVLPFFSNSLSFSPEEQNRDTF